MGLGQTLGLGITFSGRDIGLGATTRNLEKSFESLDRKVGGSRERIGDFFTGIRGKAAALLGGGVMSLGVMQLANKAGEFTQAMATVRASSSMTAAELAKLEDVALDIGVSTQFSPKDAALGMRELAQQGRDFREQTEMLGPILNLAAGSLGTLGVADAVGLTSQALSAFGMKSDQTAITVDRLAQTVNVFELNANDLSLSLTNSAAAAKGYGATLSETLISLGLVRKSVASIEKGATAVGIAMQRLGDDKVRKALKNTLKVDVGDAHQNFRRFLDVMADLQPKLAKMSQIKRANFLNELFGNDGVTAVTAIMTALESGISGIEGTGQELVENLRAMFEDAGGTSERFRDIMLDNFAGQKSLLKASLETLYTVVGKPFELMFRPVVEGVLDVINRLVAAIRAMPMPLKKALAGIVLGVGAFAALATAVLAVKGAMVFLPLVFKMGLVAVKSFLAALWPVALAVGAVAAVVAMLVVAYRRNLGGFADGLKHVYDKVALFYNAMKQVFSEGGFSGAVREELNKAENSSLKRFVIALYRIAYRVQRFGEGIRDGFVAAVEAARPVFEDLRAAVSHLWDELSKLFGGMSEGAAGIPSQKFADFGEVIGKVIGTVVSAWVWLLTRITWVYSGIVGGLRAASKWIGDAFAFIKSAVGDLVETWDKLWGSSEKSTESTGKASSFWRKLGEVIGWLLGGAFALLAYALGMVIKLIDWLIQGIQWLVDKFVELDAKLAPIRKHLLKWFTEEIPETFGKALSTVGGYFEVIGNFIAGIIGWVQGKIEAMVAWLTKVSDTVAGIVNAVDRGAGAVKNVAGDAVNSVTDFLGLGDDDEAAKPASPRTAATDGPSSKVPTPEALIKALPDLSLLRAGALRNVPTPQDFIKALPDTSMFRSARDVGWGLMADGLPATAQADAQIRALRDLATMSLPKVRTPSELAQTLQIAVQVDGETIARAVHRANEDTRARAFSPSTVPNL